MWTCSKCQIENFEEQPACRKCGKPPDAEDEADWVTEADLVPSPLPKLATADPPEEDDFLPKPVGITRRFSVGTLMILMTFFAVLFSVMKMFGAGPEIFTGISIFVIGVGLGQMFLFQGRKPRQASFISGVVMGFVSGIIALIMMDALPENRNDMSIAPIFCAIFCVCGGPFGYLAGGLLAGIFLFREREEQAAAGAKESTPG